MKPRAKTSFFERIFELFKKKKKSASAPLPAVAVKPALKTGESKPKTRVFIPGKFPERECDICEKVFQPLNSSRHYCSTACRQAANKVGIFVRKRPDPGTKATETKTEEKKIRRKRCIECGFLYQPIRKTSRLCSKKCMDRARHRRNKEARRQRNEPGSV